MSAFLLTVTPGVTIPQSGNVTITPAILRLLGTPVVSYSGTFGASTVSDGSLTPAKMDPGFISGMTNGAPVVAADYFWIERTGNLFRRVQASDVATYVLSTVGTSWTSPGALTDTVISTRGGTPKNMSLQVVFDAFGTLTELAAPTDLAIGADLVPIFDASGAATKATEPRTLVRSVTDRILTAALTGSTYAIATSSLGLSGSYADGTRLFVKFDTAAPTSPLLNVDAVGAANLKTADAQAIYAGEFAANHIAEVIYSTTASAWLVQNVRRAGGVFASVTFDGSVATSTVTAITSTNGSETLTKVAHGLVHDQLVWPDAISGFTAYTPLYVHRVDADNFKLATSKANRAAGTFVTSSGTGSSGVARYWTSNPLLGTPRNVDGVVKIGTGVYRVDFAADATDAHYAASALAGMNTGALVSYATEHSVTYPATTANFTFRLNDGSTGDVDAARVRCIFTQ